MTGRRPDPGDAGMSDRAGFGLLVALNLLMIGAVAAWWLA